MSLFVVFRIQFHNEEQWYDMLGIFTSEELAREYIKKRLKNKVDHGFKRDPVLTKENYFTTVGRRGTIKTKCPGYLIDILDLDKHYR